MATTKHKQPQCLTCLADGPGVEFPLFPRTDNRFGDICATCDNESPWLRSPLACDDCELELNDTDAWGNRKWGVPRCEVCHLEHERAVAR